MKEQDILLPETQPKGSIQAFSPMGCFFAAAGATLLSLCKLGAAMVATVWALSKLMAFPDWLMLAFMGVGALPVLWITVWTAGRAWHIEQRLAQNLDVDAPVFQLSYYFKRH